MAQRTNDELLVITALAKCQSELGVPTDEDGPTSLRQIVSGALTHLQN